MGGLQIRTWGFTHQLFKQTSSKDKRGHGWGPETLWPPGDLCSSHRPGWVLPALGPPLGHPLAAAMAPFVLLSCCFMVSAENQMLVASVTWGNMSYRGVLVPCRPCARLSNLYEALIPQEAGPFPMSPTLRGQAMPLPWERVALAWGGGGQGHMCDNTL